MDFSKSSLFPEVMNILNSKAKPVHYKHSAVLQVMGNENGEMKPAKQVAAMKVISVDKVSDYANNYADEIIVELVFSGGVYAHDIYPNLNNIEISMFKFPINELGGVSDTAKPMESAVYRGVLLDGGNPELQQNSINPLSKDELDLANMMNLKFQLFDKGIEILRTVAVGGNFRQATTEDVLKGLITDATKKTDLKGATAPTGVSMIPGANVEKYEQIVIPQGTSLIKLPGYVQQKYGVYSSGMGFYYSLQEWYIWPLMDLSRMSESERMTTIIIAPRQLLMGVERTYNVHGSATTILVTGEGHYRESSEASQLNEGTGIRFADAKRFMEDMTVSDGNTVSIKRGENNSEINAVKRPNGIDYSPFSNTPIQANPYAEYSKLAARDGNVMGLVWENSNPSLVYPGMMVRIMFQGKDKVEILEGVLQKAHHMDSISGHGITAERYRSSSAMFFYVKKKG